MKNLKKCRGIFIISRIVLIIFSTMSGCVSISTFASLVGELKDGVTVGIESPVVGLNIYTLTAGITRYKPVIKGNKKSMLEQYC